MRADEILESCLYVDNLNEAERFYRDVLGLEMVSRQADRHLFFRCGGRMLLLFDPEVSRGSDSDVPPHGAVGAGHLAFAVPEADLPGWHAHLGRLGVPIEQVVDWPQGGQSVYFRDPSGNSLELATPRIWGLSDATTIASR